MTDQHEGERVAVAAVTRAVAGRCGENAADKGADSGWMRLDDDCGGRGRAHLGPAWTRHAIQAVRLCAEYLFSSGGSERVPVAPDRLSPDGSGSYAWLGPMMTLKGRAWTCSGIDPLILEEEGWGDLAAKGFDDPRQFGYGIETKFTRAVRDICSRFEHRLFLSATPHNGHSNSFSTLLEPLDPHRFTRGVKVQGKVALEDVMVRRLQEDIRDVQGGFTIHIIDRMVIDGFPADASELALSCLLDEYRTAREQRFTASSSSLM